MAFTMSIEDLIGSDTTGMLSKHPKWERVRLGDIATLRNGAPFDSKMFSLTEGIPLVRIRDIIRGKTSTFYNGDYDPEYEVQSGDLLVGMDGDFNSAYWRGGRALLNQRVCRITPDERFYNKRFLGYVLPAYLLAINANTSSTTVKHLSSKTIADILLPLPAHNEQKRIADRLDELFSDLENGAMELAAAERKIPLYRQSILKAALEGQLTLDWREKNKHSESAQDFLERILEKRREQWLVNQIANFEEQKKAAPKGLADKYRAPPHSEVVPNAGFPPHWTFATVAQLGEVQLGRQRSPDKLIGANPTKYIRAANITEAGINLDDVLAMDFTDDEKRIFALQTGDVLLTEASGSPEHVGRPAVWTATKELYCFQNTVIRFTPLGISSDFAYWTFLALQKTGKFREISGGVGINHLSAGKFSRISIPLPSPDEQAEIVRRISNAWHRSVANEKAIKLSQRQIAAQRQSLLKTALEGSLVPQSQQDESSNVLLQKIMNSSKPEKLKATSSVNPKVYKMKAISVDAIEDWIKRRVENEFTFAELRQAFPQNYDAVKEAFFEALQQPSPLVEQAFNPVTERIYFSKK